MFLFFDLFAKYFNFWIPSWMAKLFISTFLNNLSWFSKNIFSFTFWAKLLAEGVANVRSRLLLLLILLFEFYIFIKALYFFGTLLIIVIIWDSLSSMSLFYSLEVLFKLLVLLLLFILIILFVLLFSNEFKLKLEDIN